MATEKPGLLVHLLLCLALFISTGSSTVTASSNSHSSSSPSWTTRLLQKIKGVPDDVYHCNHRQDSRWLDDDTVECIDDERLWDVDELDPDDPPDRCHDFDPDDFDGADDQWGGWYEPCMLWEMTYGELKPAPTNRPTSPPPTPEPTKRPSPAPTPSPITLPTTSGPTSVPTTVPTTSPTSVPTTSPTSGPTTSPTTSAPTTSPTTTSAPTSFDPATLNQLLISPFDLSLILPPTTISSGPERLRRRRRSRRLLNEEDIPVDIHEWKNLTEVYIFQQLQDESARLLELQFVGDPVVVEQDETSPRRVLTQRVEGVIYYDDVNEEESALVDSKIASLFESSALADYEALLKQAKDPVLASTRQVVLRPASNTDKSSNDDDSSMGMWDYIFIAGCAVAGVGLVVLMLTVYKRCRHVPVVDDDEEEEELLDDVSEDMVKAKETDRTMEESLMTHEEEDGAADDTLSAVVDTGVEVSDTDEIEFIHEDDETEEVPHDEELLHEEIPHEELLHEETPHEELLHEEIPHEELLPKEED